LSAALSRVVIGLKSSRRTKRNTHKIPNLTALSILSTSAKFREAPKVSNPERTQSCSDFLRFMVVLFGVRRSLVLAGAPRRGAMKTSTQDEGGVKMVVKVPAPKQSFGQSGFVYAIEYECGVLGEDTEFALAGTYRTNLMIHNPGDHPQKIVMKFSSVAGSAKPGSVWWKAGSQVIGPNDVLEISCDEIMAHFDLRCQKNFAKGLLIISHELPTDAEKIPLDVRAAYTYVTKVGASKDVKAVSGILVPKVPLPPG
jgi:hypothetical protein